ncbi:MAG: T9SS C-terminal target domain-containing protein, partial [Flavobacteriia bacterium]|nr:T9SS C-terminal target domain-containing protein [Flavobacteriia bacterium]
SSNSNRTVALRKGLNTVKISTDKDCQGIFEEMYFVSEDVAYSPNPFDDVLNIYVGGKDRDVKIEIFSAEGRLVSSNIYNLSDTNRNATINTSHFVMGSYMIKVSSKTVRQSFVTIKK